MRRAGFILVLAGLLFLPLVAQSQKLKVWTEQDGMVIIEAENYQPEIQENEVLFRLMKSPEGFSGKGYLVWEGKGHWKDRLPYDSLPPFRSIKYFVKINSPGTWFAKVRNYHLEEDGDNDIYISINQGNWNKVYDHQAKEWTWDENGKWEDSHPQYLKPGIYKLEIAGRSVGFGIDRITLFEEKYYPATQENHQLQPWFSKQESPAVYTKLSK